MKCNYVVSFIYPLVCNLGVISNLGVGACRPTWQEIGSELMRKAFVVADSREACMKESGDLVISKVFNV